MNHKPESDPEVWVIHVRATGDGPPVHIRVRKFLKCALRAYGLRCTRVTGENTSANQNAANEAVGAANGIDLHAQ